MVKIAGSFLKIQGDEDKIKSLAKVCDYIHFDVMDGKFTERPTFPLDNMIDKVKEFRNIDVHLMVLNVKKYIDAVISLNPSFITFHLEATSEIKNIISYIHEKGIKAGLAINPKTKVEELLPYLNDVDLVLVMSVEAGAGGHPDPPGKRKGNAGKVVSRVPEPAAGGEHGLFPGLPGGAGGRHGRIPAVPAGAGPDGVHQRPAAGRGVSENAGGGGRGVVSGAYYRFLLLEYEHPPFRPHHLPPGGHGKRKAPDPRGQLSAGAAGVLGRGFAAPNPGRRAGQRQPSYHLSPGPFGSDCRLHGDQPAAFHVGLGATG